MLGFKYILMETAILHLLVAEEGAAKEQIHS